MSLQTKNRWQHSKFNLVSEQPRLRNNFILEWSSCGFCKIFRKEVEDMSVSILIYYTCTYLDTMEKNSAICSCVADVELLPDGKLFRAVFSQVTAA